MHQNVSHLGSTAGTLFLICYVIAGVITAAAGFLPGNASRLRLVCVTFGLAFAGWSAKVLFTGGPMLIGLAVLLAPLSLTTIAIIGTCRAYSRRHAPTRLSRPHPAAARTYTEPNSPFPPVVPVPVHAPWPSTHLAPADPFLPSPATRSSSLGAHLFPVGAHSAPVSGAHLTTAVLAPTGPAPAHLATPAAQRRFHGHAIAPPPAFPTPPRFAPQPLHNVPAPQPHNVPAPRPALDDHITARFQGSANHLQPSPSLSSRSSLAPSPEPFASQHPSSAQEWARAHAWTGDQPAVHDRTDSSSSRHSSRRLRGVVPSQNLDTITSSPPIEPSMRMALAPVTDPSPLQPSSVRARHRAAGTSA
ncbi:hypothetical protein AB0J72_29435 [Dactylosporangium sp. NPDC049742]|uniref:hypothetical protein n=1 Tax=Dactylosporangium sp. NPDC049742 TaxID=3154737 RepID=UPI0034370D78